jgi:DNA-binding NarL/FixJ family response regulator
LEDEFQAELDAYHDSIKQANLQTEEALRKQEEAIVLLVKSGVAKTIISETLQISIDTIDQILKKANQRIL